MLKINLPSKIEMILPFRCSYIRYICMSALWDLQQLYQIRSRNLKQAVHLSSTCRTGSDVPTRASGLSNNVVLCAIYTQYMLRWHVEDSVGGGSLSLFLSLFPSLSLSQSMLNGVLLLVVCFLNGASN